MWKDAGGLGEKDRNHRLRNLEEVLAEQELRHDYPYLEEIRLEFKGITRIETLTNKLFNTMDQKASNL